MSTIVHMSTATPNRMASWVNWVTGWFEHIPYWLVALTSRIALADIFWRSAQAHLASWQTTLYMFHNSFKLPFLAPTPAAYITIAIELVVPPLLILGLATRFASLVIFGMTLVIEIFVFPQAWPTHIQWAAMMLVLMAYGAGPLSLDWLIRRWAGVRSSGESP